MVPDDDYLARVHALCKKHDVLLICDEIQTGIGRTGRMLCSEWAGIKPDLVTLGKAISGGMYPVSCVLGSKDVMLTIEPGTHGSTYGGNPLGCAVSIRALEIMEEEDLTARAQALGSVFRKGLADIGISYHYDGPRERSTERDCDRRGQNRRPFCVGYLHAPKK